MMKTMMISMMMFLTALASEAQVMTSATVTNLYEKVATSGGNGFVYNAEYNDRGDIVAMDVYQKRNLYKDVVRLVPSCRYQYAYAEDGLLISRELHGWHHGKWQLRGRHVYQLADGLYTVEYSRWNRKKNRYDQSCCMMTYNLLPDESVMHVACYSRHREDAPMKLEWQSVVERRFADADYFLTKE